MSVATLTEPRTCGCGCGASVTRRYRPGHDAKHKSNLFATLTGAPLAATRAADLLTEFGWDHLAPLGDLRPVAYRQSNGRPTTLVDDVTRWQVDHLGVCHADRRCRHLTANAKAANAIHPITKLARDSYITYRDATPSEALRLRGSWDQCATCTYLHTRDEEAETRQMSLVLASELEFKPRPGAPRKSRAKVTPEATPHLAPWQTARPEVDPTSLPTLSPTARPVSTDRPLSISERADAILARIFGT